MVILVWLLDIRLMNLLTPGDESVLLLNHTFILGSRTWCQHLPTSHLNQVPFLDQTVKGFRHGLDSILTDSIDTSELDASFDETDAMPSSISSGLLCLISTISYNV